MVAPKKVGEFPIQIVEHRERPSSPRDPDNPTDYNSVNLMLLSGILSLRKYKQISKFLMVN